ncbi:MAG: TrkA family potassium uptake protein [Chloroflexi bacterium]|nr:TrkA family potassium uptake protein [Chloroflexota bacterium]
MHNQVVVLGLGRFGATVARNLYQLDHQVLALDRDERAIQEIAPFVTEAVQTNVTDEAALRDLGVANFDVALVTIGSDVSTSIMTTVLLKNIGVPYIVARAHNDLHAATLQRLGVDKVVSPEFETGARLAHSLTYPTIVDYLEVSRDYGISKVAAPESYIGKTLEDLGLSANRQQDGVSVLLIRRGNNQVVASPDRFEKVLRGDVLVLSGRDEALEKLHLF